MFAHWKVVLRLFAATDDPSVADDLAGLVASKAGKFGGVQTRPVERYWKIPEYYEVGIELRPDGEASVAYEGMLARVAGRAVGDLEPVGRGSLFLTPGDLDVA